VKKLRLIAFFLCLILVLPLGACGESTNVTPSSTVAITKRQTGNLKAVAMSTEHFSFNRGEMTYLYAISYMSFLNKYYAYLSAIGLDTEKSFKEQKSTFSEGTWFEFFMQQAKDYATNYLLFCEAAQELGLSLDESDKAFIQEEKKLLSEEAASYGWNVATFLSQLYGTNIEWQYMESCYEKMRLAQKAYDHLIANKQFSDEELEAEYKKNPNQYAVFDYYHVDLGDGEDLSDELIAACREGMEKALSFEDFRTVVKDFLAKTRTTSDLESMGGLESYTDKYLSERLIQGESYMDNDFCRWVFSDESREEAVFQVESETTKATVAYCLMKKPHRDETPLVDVRHILIGLKAYGGNYEEISAARQEAERVMQEWLEKGGSEESFADLVSRYSSDSGSVSNGGLYANVEMGDMVESFNNWIFDESRKAGDYGIVETPYGAHIIYFVRKSLRWKVQTDDALFSEFYNSTRDSFMEKYPIETKDEVLNAINW